MRDCEPVTGFASVRRIVESRPAFVKLDR